jgi:hypothetical protein
MPKESVKHICINCLHFKQCPTLQGECHKNAPTAVQDPVTKEIQAFWPPTVPDESCGDWKRNTTPEEKQDHSLLITVMEQVINDWNAMAERRQFPQVSRIPTGKTGAMLIARVKDKDWMATYKIALSKLLSIRWIQPGGRLGKFGRFIEPDTVRQFVDGEWDDHKDKSISG